MLERRNLVPLPTFCVAALLTLFITGMAVAQAPCPGNAPCPRYTQVPCDPYRCCESCTPNVMYWGYWPTTWRQWPQRRPDIRFSQDSNLEQLPTPPGTVPEPLPKEEPFAPPTAPSDSFLPPVGEGPATGPGEPDLPFDFNRDLDQGPGFDQSLPPMENLPAEQPSPMTLPIEGTEDAGAQVPSNGSSDETSNDSILTQQPRVPLDLNDGPAVEEGPSLEEDRQPEKTRLSPLAGNAVEPENNTSYEPVAPLPSDTCLASVGAAAQEFLPADEAHSPAEHEVAAGPIDASDQSPPMPKADDTVRRTVFESPAEPWTALKTWETDRTHDQQPLPEPDEPAEQIEQSNSAPEPQGNDGLDDSRMPVGLDGYCPVTLVHNGSWALGDSRLAVEFEGRRYSMSGPEQHRAFRSNPERYAPVDSGFDPVLSFEENTRHPGRTDACAVFDGRLYMFSDADSLARFQSDPYRYTRALERKRK